MPMKSLQSSIHSYIRSATVSSADKTTAQDQLKSALSEVLRARSIQQALQNMQHATPANHGLAAKYASGIPAEWSEAQALMIIVPDGAQVTAEVTLENKDIGFVNVGNDAAIKLETFPFTRYGTVAAQVDRVTADAVNDEKRGAIFPVTLALKTKQIDVDGKMIQLVPGMNLTAEIKTGQRRVIEYLLSPIQRAGSESLRER